MKKLRPVEAQCYVPGVEERLKTNIWGDCLGTGLGQKVLQ